MIEDFGNFNEKRLAGIKRHEDARAEIIAIKQSIIPLQERMLEERKKIRQGFIDLMSSPSRSLSDFTDIDFSKVVYQLVADQEISISGWESLFNQSFKNVKTFLEVTPHWSRDEDCEGGAPVWGLRLDAYSLKDDENYLAEALRNTAKYLPAIFDVCDQLSENYCIFLSDIKGITFLTDEEWELSREGEGWVVKWNAELEIDKEADYETYWDIDLSRPQSHYESTVEGILEWIVKNVWDKTRNQELCTVKG